jgi:hypothetical protein
MLEKRQLKFEGKTLGKQLLTKKYQKKHSQEHDGSEHESAYKANKRIKNEEAIESQKLIKVQLEALNQSLETMQFSKIDGFKIYFADVPSNMKKQKEE